MAASRGMSPSRSGKAVAGFVLGLISIILFLTIVVPLLALIFGVLGLREIGRSNGMRTGRGMAITGIVLGTLGLLGGGALWVVIGHEVATTTGATELEVGQCVKLPGADGLRKVVPVTKEAAHISPAPLTAHSS